MALSQGVSTQQFFPQTEASYYPDGRMRFEVENAENGYILRYGNHNSLTTKTFICTTPQDLANQIIASMVTNKMEK